MKRVRGVWLPDADTHFERMMWKAPWTFRAGRLIGQYQKDKLDAALEVTKKRRVAVDIGAHVGFYSMWLAETFRQVEAFEPVDDHADCFVRNITSENVRLHRCAVGDRCGLIAMRTDATNSGKAKLNGAGSIPMIRLDDVGLEKVDFIKIDVEGAEPLVITGALDTIQRCKPVMIVEQNDDTLALEMLLAIGMRVHAHMGADWLLKW